MLEMCCRNAKYCYYCRHLVAASQEASKDLLKSLLVSWWILEVFAVSPLPLTWGWSLGKWQAAACSEPLPINLRCLDCCLPQSKQAFFPKG